ncbi:glycosyltransferase family 2 protein [Fulvivirga maritima]|uniref:glycosyltransferase family 2 protein n=1 Tax=Fulvivirga maritima TaxID=2904247 RepID=UPI001F48E906|nr:glycosyltransferase family 2 protein [Fulvivirga maritima]UII24508.1 glycosyltransferase family 2 protein [Fulvivirga maritima]
MPYDLNISVVVPLYNEEESLPELCNWISRVMQTHGFTYEIILVDDGSSDTSWEVLSELSQNNPNIKGIRFNRNFGKSAALNTGFKKAKGEVVISMDADLQDSPDEIPALYEMITAEKYHMVSGWKKKRHDPLGKTIPSKFFNRITRIISGIKLHDFNCGLKAYHNRVVKNIQIYGEMHRYIPVIAKWNGFYKIGEKVVEHRARKYGYTKFGFTRMVGLLDLLSITFVSKFKRKPMHFFGTLGTLSFFAGLIITMFIIGDKLYRLHYHLPVRDVTAQPLFFLALVALVIGVQLFLTGFLAEMMAMKSQSSNEYLVVEEIGIDK